MIARNPSPLRYPGGKGSLSDTLRQFIYASSLQGCTYVEPFAGGAGAGLKLLNEGHVKRLLINDQDLAIYCFWKSVTKDPYRLADRIRTVPLDLEEWVRQREVYRNPGRQKHFDLGFSAFYLNRCNRSGIIKNGGPIGGQHQAGEWKIDARFNRDALAQRVLEIAEFGDRLIVTRQDAKYLLTNLDSYVRSSRVFVYADPPYFLKGRELYLNHFADSDHVSFADSLKSLPYSWLVTYDDAPRIREIYKGHTLIPYNLRYSAHQNSKSGNELIIVPSQTKIPQAFAMQK